MAKSGNQKGKLLYLAYNVSFYLSNLPFHLPVWP